MKLFEITTDRCFYIIAIFGIKISIKSKKLLEEKLNEKESKLYEKELKLHEIQNNAISNIKESISELQKENMLKKYDICFLQLVHNSDMDNLYKYFHGYNYKIIRFKKIPELFSDLGLKNFIAILSSKIVVINIDTYITNDHLFEDQILINLWHACGVFKKIGPGRNDSADFYYKFDYFITSGNICNKIYSDNFLTDINKFISLGVSRTDNLFDENYINNVKTEFYNKNPDLKNKKIYFYCPTFREEIINEFIFKSNLDLTKLSELLYDNEVFIFKLHPFLISRINNNQ
ncbi:CDP-glycerol glycerophosphotransferase family protein, partial [uncultured Brachyspira sp.]